MLDVMGRIAERDLYKPVKAYLTAPGHEVKAEAQSADVEAQRGDDPPLIVELKTGFTLSLFHQASARQAATDALCVAVARGSGRRFQAALKSNLKLARRLGVGVITVQTADGRGEVHLDPGPYALRKSPARRAALLKEFARRAGDPNTGGSTRGQLVTAYRRDALRCAAVLAEAGPSMGAAVATGTGVPHG